MNEAPVTEQVNPDTTGIDQLPTLNQVRLMNAQDALVPAAVGARAREIAAVVDAVAARLRDGGRLVYAGAGTAGRLGILDASEIPPTFGEDPTKVVGLIAGGRAAITDAVENAEDNLEAGRADLEAIDFGPDDALVGIAASGRTPYVIGALRHARSIGAFTAAVSCNPDSAIGREAEVAIEVVVGPEVITGSTRLKSGTAQKLVLNTISTLAMVKLGKTYGNLMVDVRATNEKLHRRSERLVSIATGVDVAAARSALDACGGSVKTAIAMVLTGLDAEAASALLAEHDGFLREAIRARD